MPKAIESYRKLTASPIEPETSNPLPNVVPLAILFIVVIFSFSIGNDAHSQMEAVEKKMKEDAKLCMVEFGQKGCDILNPNMECQGLLDCVQLKDGGSKISSFVQLCSEEILKDFHFPTVMVGLLLLYHLGQSLKSYRKRDHLE